MCTVEMRHTYKVLVGKLEWNILLKRPKRNWEDNIKMVHKDIWYESED